MIIENNDIRTTTIEWATSTIMSDDLWAVANFMSKGVDNILKKVSRVIINSGIYINMRSDALVVDIEQTSRTLHTVVEGVNVVRSFYANSNINIGETGRDVRVDLRGKIGKKMLKSSLGFRLMILAHVFRTKYIDMILGITAASPIAYTSPDLLSNQLRKNKIGLIMRLAPVESALLRAFTIFVVNSVQIHSGWKVHVLDPSIPSADTIALLLRTGMDLMTLEAHKADGAKNNDHLTDLRPSRNGDLHSELKSLMLNGSSSSRTSTSSKFTKTIVDALSLAHKNHASSSKSVVPLILRDSNGKVVVLGSPDGEHDYHVDSVAELPFYLMLTIKYRDVNPQIVNSNSHSNKQNNKKSKDTASTTTSTTTSTTVEGIVIDLSLKIQSPSNISLANELREAYGSKAAPFGFTIPVNYSSGLRTLDDKIVKGDEDISADDSSSDISMEESSHLIGTKVDIDTFKTWQAAEASALVIGYPREIPVLFFDNSMPANTLELQLQMMFNYIEVIQNEVLLTWMTNSLELHASGDRVSSPPKKSKKAKKLAKIDLEETVNALNITCLMPLFDKYNDNNGPHKSAPPKYLIKLSKLGANLKGCSTTDDPLCLKCMNCSRNRIRDATVVCWDHALSTTHNRPICVEQMSLDNISVSDVNSLLSTNHSIASGPLPVPILFFPTYFDRAGIPWMTTIIPLIELGPIFHLVTQFPPSSVDARPPSGVKEISVLMDTTAMDEDTNFNSKPTHVSSCNNTQRQRNNPGSIDGNTTASAQGGGDGISSEAAGAAVKEKHANDVHISSNSSTPCNASMDASNDASKRPTSVVPRRNTYAVGLLQEAVQRMHALDLCHRDIRAANVFYVQTINKVIEDGGSETPQGWRAVLIDCDWAAPLAAPYVPERCNDVSDGVQNRTKNQHRTGGEHDIEACDAVPNLKPRVYKKALRMMLKILKKEGDGNEIDNEDDEEDDSESVKIEEN